MSEPRSEALRRFIGTNIGSVGLLLVGFLLGTLAVGFGGPSESTSVAPPIEQVAQWTCSMHPQIRQSEPGACPICGMDLISVSSTSAGETEGHRVTLSERARALARLRTTTVRRRSAASTEVRLLGRIEPDETTLKSITAWTGGRIERLHVKVTGQRVRAGQTIATLYSPEVFAAHQDLLVAKKQVSRLSQSPQASRDAAAAALEAVRQRLRLLGVPDDTLARMERQTKPTRRVSIRTPFAGTVIERVATEGAYVATGTPLYRLADLKKLWVQLDAYESDLARLSQGQQVEIEVEALPGEVFRGEVTFIGPTLDTRRRTSQVRVEVDNADGRLRPGMFAQATVAAPTAGASPLVVPATAPLFTGRRAIVYLELDDGARTVYEPRTVRLGPRLGNHYPVVAGLSGGERVVLRGAFALDADLQIRGGTSMMASPDDRDATVWDHAITLDPEYAKRLAPVLEHYLELQRALASDELDRAHKAAQQLEHEVAKVDLQPEEAAKVWAGIGSQLRAHAHHVDQATDLETARVGFEGVTEQISTLLGRFGNPLDRPVHLAFCPMAQGTEGASWIQQGETIDNAYFGNSMRTCGEVRQEIAPGAYLNPPVDTPMPGGAFGGHQH